MNIKVKINYTYDDLFCCYSKERINYGERYVEVTEDYLGDEIVKLYRPEYAPTEEDEEPFISEQ